MKTLYNQFKAFVLLTSMTVIAACGGGGGGGGGGSNPPPPPPNNTLVPLEVSLQDLSGNPINYVDVSKIGSHTWYKTVFTNPNSVTVTRPQNLGYDELWIGHDQFIKNISYESGGYYAELYQPGLYDLNRYYEKTTNPDDCLVKNQIEPGGNCAFYTYAYNEGINGTKKNNDENISMFSIPLSYKINQVDGGAYLMVEQCHYDVHTREYDCSNIDKPKYKKQFMSYKMLPLKKATYMYPDKMANESMPTYARLRYFDPNGSRYYYKCGGVGAVDCAKYEETYDKGANTLKESEVKGSDFTMNSASYFCDTCKRWGYVKPGGNYGWIITLNFFATNGGGFRFTRSDIPSVRWYASNGPTCAPDDFQCIPSLDDANSDIFQYVPVNGLDGSFWWNAVINGTDNHVTVSTVDVYVESSIESHSRFMSLESADAYGSNDVVPNRVYAVMPGGVVLGATKIDDTQLALNKVDCFHKQSDTLYTKYASLNGRVARLFGFVSGPKDNQGIDATIYMKQYMPTLTSNGDPTPTPLDNSGVQPYYKVHTENGKCEIDLDDYTMVDPSGYGFNSGGRYFISHPFGEFDPNYNLYPLSEVYLGK